MQDFFILACGFAFPVSYLMEAPFSLQKEDVSMNKMQKEKVRQMRGYRISYSKIAKAVGLPENTVKSFCRRNQLNIRAESVVGSSSKGMPYCLNCSKQITQTPGHRGRKYCSDRCRITWWNKRPVVPGRKNIRSFTCLACGKQFDTYGKRERKYCSRTCSAGSKAVRP